MDYNSIFSSYFKSKGHQIKFVRCVKDYLESYGIGLLKPIRYSPHFLMIKKLVEQNEDSLTFTIENEESTNSIVKYLVDEIGFCIVDITKLADFDYLPDDIKQKMKSITKGLNVSYPELSVEVTPGFAFLSNFDKENWIRVNSYLSAPLEIKYIFGNTELMEIILDFIDIVKNKIDEQKIKRISREFPAVVIEGFEFYSE